MTDPASRFPLGTALALVVAFAITGYFGFAAVQGDHGMFRRMQIDADLAQLETRRAALQGELEAIANLTSRLSDTRLDLDLLDERARVVLGYMRADEVVVH